MKALLAAAGGMLGASFYAHKNAEVMAKSSAPSPFSAKDWGQFPLIGAYDESHDTKIFRFALPKADTELALPVASCITFRYMDEDGKAVVRPYTPLNSSSDKGYFDVLVKKYKGSKMGSHLFALKKGETIDAMGPWMKIPIRANQYKDIGLLGGGTGITPLYQVAREVLCDPQNKTNVSLIYANRRKEDILLGNELTELTEKYPLFSPYYVLSQAPSDWVGGVGRVHRHMIKSLMPGPVRGGDSIIMVCGPPGFMESICGDKDFTTKPPSQGELKGLLKELGYTSKQVFKF